MQPRSPNSRERLVVTGAPGSGKSRALLDIALMHQKRGSDARFHIFCTDDGIPDLLEGDRFSGLNNLQLYFCSGWGDIEEATAKIAGPNWKEEPRKDVARPYLDWIVVDTGDKPWTWAQRAYTHSVYGKDLYDILLEQRVETQASGNQPKSKKDPHADKFGGLRGETDWVYVNALYLPWQEWLFLRSRAHIYVATPSKAIRREEADKDIGVDKAAGVKPEGQKDITYSARTVLLFKQFGDQFLMQTLNKDRERERLAGVPIGDFSVSYLVRVGGWKL